MERTLIMDKYKLENYQVWFITGSQHLYGTGILKQVPDDSMKIVEHLNKSGKIAVEIIWKPTVTALEEITGVINDANHVQRCIGIICWMHTFSPAKMWINGLKILHKPMLHLHTQFNRDIPWESIDMDFMNLNQSAHGDREFGFICTRMNIRRKVIAGHWQNDKILKQIDNWTRAAIGVTEASSLKVARFGDNMREVAVTEGDKIAAQIQFGFSVNGYGIGDLVKFVHAVTDAEIDSLVKEYKEFYTLRSAENTNSIREAAKLEAGIRAFLENGNFGAFTTTFEDLHGIRQLPGLACQRLMAEGYGFGAEGDWKTAALLRIIKTMSIGLPGGTSFMEDYTYHLEEGREKVLGAHMLEVCPSIASDKPSLEVHPLGIGGKEAPARLIFNGSTGPALNASLIDSGDKFRLVINEVETVKSDTDLPKLPVARVMWIPKPDFKTALEAWIHAGGAHHTVYSQAVSSEILKDFAEMTALETVMIR